MDRSLSLNRDADGLMIRSNIALKQNDIPLADKLVDEAYRLEPKRAPVMVAKIKQLERAGDTAGVIALSDQMIALYPIVSDPVTAKVRAYMKLNQDAKAKAALDAYSAFRTKSAVVYFYRSVLLSRAKDKKGAAQLIQSLPLSFARDNPDLASQMAQIVLDNGNVENAAAILGAGLGGAPDQVDLRIKLAELRMGQDSPQSALLVLNPVQDSNDTRVQALLKKVRARIAKDRAF
jgi:predicted Zn-dependent protease